MLLHMLFSVFLCAHYDQQQEGAILELHSPDDQTKEIVLCKVFHKDNGICSCVFGSDHFISPKLSLDPRTLLGYLLINADGWLETADSFQRNPASIPDVHETARTSPGLSGPVSVYFVLQLEIVMPPNELTFQLKEYMFAFGSNASLFSFDRDRYNDIVEVPNTVGVRIYTKSHAQLDVVLNSDGKVLLLKTINRDKSVTDDVWSLDLGVFINFRNKEIAFVNVEQSVMISRHQGIDTSQPLFSLIKIRNSRARISSGKEVHISREIKELLLRNIS